MLNLGVDLEPGDTPGPAKGAHEAPWKITDLEPGGDLEPGLTWNLGAPQTPLKGRTRDWA